jgi:hypothetical protein
MIDLEKGERTIIGLETIQAKENEIRKDIQWTRASKSRNSHLKILGSSASFVAHSDLNAAVPRTSSIRVLPPGINVPFI